MITNNAICPREIKYGIATVKEKFNKNRTISAAIVLKFREVTTICYIRDVALCGAEIWALQKVYHKYVESSDVWCWGRMEKTVDESCEK